MNAAFLWEKPLTKRVLSASLLVVVFCQGLVAQEAQSGDARLKTAGVVRTATPPVIDGRLDEKVWFLASVVEDLHQTQPNEFAAPSERTESRLLYDENALYVGVRLWDSEADGIVARVLRQGELVLGDDHFGVILDPFNNRRSGYMFIVNPNSVRVDALYRNANQMQFDWDGIFNASATQDDQGWVAEMAIPFKTLSFDPNNDTWGINFMRVIGRKNERLAWVSRNRSLNPSIAGLAAGFAGRNARWPRPPGSCVCFALRLTQTESFRARHFLKNSAISLHEKIIWRMFIEQSDQSCEFAPELAYSISPAFLQLPAW